MSDLKDLVLKENNNIIPPLCNGANGSPLPELDEVALDDIYMNNFKIIMSRLPDQEFLMKLHDKTNRNSNAIEHLEFKVKNLTSSDLWHRFVAAVLSTISMILTIKVIWF